MPVKIISVKEQAKGAFNDGEILENKPIGFPQDGGNNKPYSNLFYWAHAYSDVDSTIGEHPHKGFEIMSFVLKGTIEHYDSKLGDWITLTNGDVQIIRAGNGISHAEKLNAGAHIFQIWFDPDIRKTMSMEATYDDYKASSFPSTSRDGITKTIIKGDNAPVKMESEGITIERWTVEPGSHSIKLQENLFYSVYNLNNSYKMDDKLVQKDDFIIINSELNIDLITESNIELFVISSPVQISHPTYASMYA